MQLDPYLIFNGNTLEAFEFYKTVFGGEFLMVTRYGDTEGGDKMSKNVQDKIMHVALKVGENNLMGSDAVEAFSPLVQTGTNINLSLNFQSKAEADKIYQHLSDKGQAMHPPAVMPWGYFGMLIDKFGIQWMVNVDTSFLTAA